MTRASCGAFTALLLGISGSADALEVDTSSESSGLDEFLDAPADSSSAPVIRATWQLDLQVAADTGHEDIDAHVGRLDVSGRMVLDAELTSGMSAFAAPKFQYVAAISKSGDDREQLFLEAPEAFVRISLGPFRLRLGNLIFAWGVSDLVGPIDVLNPIDLRASLFTDVGSAKLPVLGVEATYGAGPLTLRGVVLPVFTASRFRLDGWDTALSVVLDAAGFPLPSFDAMLSPSLSDRVLDEAIAIDRPSDSPENATLALRATLGLGEVDLGVSVVHGFEPLPTVYIDRDAAVLLDGALQSFGSGQPFDLTDPELLGAIGRIRDAQEQGRPLFMGTYDRRTVVGFDGSIAVDPLLLKVDAAYTFERTLYTQEFQSVRLPYLNAMIGLEYAEGEDLQADVEVFAIAAAEVRSYYRLLFLEGRSDPPSSTDVGARTIAMPGVAAALRSSFFLDGDLETAIAVISTFDPVNVVLMARLRYSVDDQSSIVAGAVGVAGKHGSFGELYSHLDEVFVGYRLAL
ncbi:MAG: hypothetical protein HY791_37835 [Deltaproteobacteria bacterium]|nr:hypothetical protein [Deltaproteobacteria bacterium]